jgi:hypothetical protein
MIFDQKRFRSPGELKAFLGDPKNRAEANKSLRRFLVANLCAQVADDLVPIRPPLFNRVEGFHGSGMTDGYVSAAVAPGDVGGADTGVQRQVYFVPEPGVDQQWKNVFARRQSTRAGETYEGAAALFTFEEIPLGGKPKLAQILDTAGFVKNKKYGAAISVFRTWIEDGEVWTINTVLAAGRRAALRKQAELAYTALTDASFATINTESTWQATLNKAFATLERSGVLSSGVVPLVVCPSELAGTFVQIKHDMGSKLLTGNQVTYPFDVISTPHFAANASPRVVVPGEGFFWQDRQELRQDDDRDIMLDADNTTFDFRGNFVVLATKGISPTTGKLETSATCKQGLTLALSGS